MNNTLEAGGTEHSAGRFSMDYQQNSAFRNGMVNGRHYATASMVAFVLPNGDLSKAKDEDFKAGNYKQVLSADEGDNTYPISLYDADEFYGAKAMVIVKDAVTKISDNDRLAVVCEVGTGLNDKDEAAMTLSFYKNGGISSLMVADDAVVTKDFAKDAGEENRKISDLAPGDVIHYAQNTKGEIAQVYLVATKASKNRSTGFFLNNFAESPSKNMNEQSAYLVGFGRIERLSGNQAVLNMGDLSAYDAANSRSVALGGNVYLVDAQKGKVTLGAVEDIAEGDIVLVRCCLRAMWDVVIFR